MRSSAIYSVAVRAARDLDPTLRTTLEAWFAEQFGHTSYQWAPPSWYVVVWHEDVPVGRLGMVSRDICVGGTCVNVGGIAGVATRPEWHRRGIASRALRTAADFIAHELGYPFALLLCRPEVSPVYAKLGWEVIDARTSFAQPRGSATYPHLTMILPLGNAAWPPGPINLRGLPW